MLDIETSEDRQLCGEEDEEVPGVRLPVPGLNQRHREHGGHLADQRQLVRKNSKKRVYKYFGHMLLTKLPNALL